MFPPNDSEIRPDRAVQQAPPERLDHRRDSNDVHAVAFSQKEEVVRKEWDSHDVIEVGMGDEDMLQPQLTLDVKSIGQASRVKQDVPVQQKAGRPVSGELSS